jgi:NADH dehydrogenase/NADH:ubiquinone oxidoreductase subunit G
MSKETKMTRITLTIDGETVQAEEGASLLEVARRAGADIPTLCQHEKLKPRGACRLCMVEVVKGKRRRLVASCAYPAEDGIVVRTSTPELEKHRKLLVELLYPTALHLAKRYGITQSRFGAERGDCNLCGLCVNYCQEVAHKNVLYWEGRGIERKVTFVPGKAQECASCGGCFELCSGGFVVTNHGAIALNER